MWSNFSFGSNFLEINDQIMNLIKSNRFAFIRGKRRRRKIRHWTCKQINSTNQTSSSPYRVLNQFNKRQLDRFQRIQSRKTIFYFVTKFSANKHNNYKYILKYRKLRNWNLHKQYHRKICIDSKLFRVQILIKSSSDIINNIINSIVSHYQENKLIFQIGYAWDTGGISFFTECFSVYLIFFQTEKHRAIQLFVDMYYYYLLIINKQYIWINWFNNNQLLPILVCVVRLIIQTEMWRRWFYYFVLQFPTDVSIEFLWLFIYSWNKNMNEIFLRDSKKKKKKNSFNIHSSEQQQHHSMHLMSKKKINNETTSKKKTGYWWSAECGRQ